MNIHLIRHAKSTPSSDSGIDFDRALSNKGIRQCQLLKNYLSHFPEIHKNIYCSSSNRTKSTLNLVFNEKQLDKLIYKDELYLATAKFLFEFIIDLNSMEDITIIGHNEGLSYLATYLTGQTISLQTASLFTIFFDIPYSSWISKDTGVVTNQFSPQI